MKVVLNAWDAARRTLQQLLGSVAYESKSETVAPAAADVAFRVHHNLPVGIKPTSVSGTVLGKGFVYYNEGDRVLWTANAQGTSTQTPQQGIVVVRCSLAKAKCEIRVRAYDG